MKNVSHPSLLPLLRRCSQRRIPGPHGRGCRARFGSRESDRSLIVHTIMVHMFFLKKKLFRPGKNQIVSIHFKALGNRGENGQKCLKMSYVGRHILILTQTFQPFPNHLGTLAIGVEGEIGHQEKKSEGQRGLHVVGPRTELCLLLNEYNLAIKVHKIDHRTEF